MISDSQLAPYASDPMKSRGRLFDEPEAKTRTAFQRDRDRIIHSAAFRRLQYKTQVFVYHEGDHYRTRLTHSLEVAQIARSICRALNLNEDLAEALALAHDLGHTPFGHAGEEVLDRLMQPYGGFDHNAQALRVITLLEHRYAEFPGLNLTWETLEGTVKHNGPVLSDPLPLATAEYIAGHDLELYTYAGPEAQVAALADDIAYDNHDIDDGLRAELFPSEDLAQVPLVGPILSELQDRYNNVDREILAHETVRRLIGIMVDDVISESRQRLDNVNANRVEDIRALPDTAISISDGMKVAQDVLKQFLLNQMYRHPKVNKMTDLARRVVSDLFDLYMAKPEHLPSVRGDRAPDPIRRVADFIAGMTDRFALEEHRRHFGELT